ncbi:MAG: type IX secretion system sortase PorU [Bacteroidia bacterium]
MTPKIFKMLLALAIIFLLSQNTFSQSRHYKILWEDSNLEFPGNFNGAQAEFYAKDQFYPIWVFSELTGKTTFDVHISNEVYVPITANSKVFEYLKNVKNLEIVNGEERGQNRVKVKLIPYRVIGQNIERLVSFDLSFTPNGKIESRLDKKGNVLNSVLASGDWFKIRIGEDGVYKLDKAFFKANSISTDNIDLATFKIYGNGGGMLPEIIADHREDDLKENAIKINDANGNNRMDDGDFISFYGKGPDSWKDNNTDYTHIKNSYSNYAFYFFTWGGSGGKRISETGDGSSVTPIKIFTESDFLFVHEDESFNLRNSGREWFGEVLTIESKSFDVNIPDRIDSLLGHFKSEVAVRTAITRGVNVFLNDGFYFTHGDSPVDFAGDGNYASIDARVKPLPPGSNFKITYEYIRPQLGSEAWINYFEIQCKRKLKPVNGQIHFFNLDIKNPGKYGFQIEDFNSGFTIWDVTDPMNASLQKTFDKDGKATFVVDPNSKLLKFLLFKNGSEKTPEMVGKLPNQNLHNLAAVDFIIIAHSGFMAQAERLGKFHQERDGYTYLITTPDKIYNEFSSGATDITAIRDFVKMIYDRAGTDTNNLPKALLLLGDASYDYKNRLGNGNFVPTLESYEYNNSISSYCSDDYFVILGDMEGKWAKDPGTWPEYMDMGVGRLPAKSGFEADVMVDKCIHYKTNSNKGEWRSSVTLLGDDEDGNVHIDDSGSEAVAKATEKKYPTLNLTKIYLDAYKQVSLGNGNAYPEVNEAINNTIAKGTLIFNYLGHGGGSGMAHERVVTRPQIMGWKNYDKLTFFVTGTCDLAQYDNPAEESPGELMMINNEGGAIGMMTTTRKVYIGVNTTFSVNLFRDFMFEREGNHFITFGKAYYKVKNAMWRENNIRNYVLFGDPLLDLNLPVQKTLITSINGNPVTPSSRDTLKALSKVEIEGVVTNLTGNILTDFNGDVAITLFDKKQTFKTLANDPESQVMPFSIRNNVLYRGKASVTAGKFKVIFILPKDIDYALGSGRIFTYAYNTKTDAVGIYDSALVGGTSPIIAKDDKGPDIQVYLEDEKFVNGGIVPKDPLLIVKLWDENGINTAGNGVGREILGILDKGGETSKNYILNDFYSTTLDSFQGGEVRIRLADMTPGTHTLLVRAWDVYNNSNEELVEFVVANNENMAIRNLLNYPNPFTNRTSIIFDHNKAGQELSVAINIFSISGKIVKTIYSKIPNATSHIDQIEWDGKDEYGQSLARGVYLYKVTVKAEDGKSEHEFQKMVLLK